MPSIEEHFIAPMAGVAMCTDELHGTRNDDNEDGT